MTLIVRESTWHGNHHFHKVALMSSAWVPPAQEAHQHVAVLWATGFWNAHLRLIELSRRMQTNHILL